MIITNFEAILSLMPEAKITQVGEDVTWHDPNQIPLGSAVIEQERLRLQKIEDDTFYKRQREKEYPPIGDQLDALFHAGVFPPEMQSLIQEVKNKYPKPE
jgi:hypothetical protein